MQGRQGTRLANALGRSVLQWYLLDKHVPDLESSWHARLEEYDFRPGEVCFARVDPGTN